MASSSWSYFLVLAGANGPICLTRKMSLRAYPISLSRTFVSVIGVQLVWPCYGLELKWAWLRPRRPQPAVEVYVACKPCRRCSETSLSVCFPQTTHERNLAIFG
ncbi:hypothetical protein N657DRAFT_158985 [Parathielavia appendiculata]|uniref:Uncharacterized protein n=1 Tax=Parathielavia appendiculata TaxID=2587402 RepID=A0AAN6TU90_9PEZI|nr:hypothetical protein N657DRAFT_158985 [Parathielavia appendiculata]